MNMQHLPSRSLEQENCDASYDSSPLPSSVGNPFMEALPQELSSQELLSLLSPDSKRLKAKVAAGRLLCPSSRRDLAASICQTFIVLPRHLNLASRLVDLVRRSYEFRNPCMAADASKRLPYSADILLSCAIRAPMIMGAAGHGKTISVARALNSCVPRLIRHTKYDGKSFRSIQIPWIFANTSHDASLKQLCANIAESIDAVGQSSVAADVGKARTEYERGSIVARNLDRMNVGLLVIDEIQNLIGRSRSDAATSARFLTTLINQTHTKVMLVGTRNSAELISSSPPLSRRTQGESGHIHWDQLQPGEEWDQFLNKLWQQQYTNVHSPLTPEFSRAMFERSSGVPDSVVKLFVEIQRLLIGSRDERISADYIHSAADRIFPRALAASSSSFGESQMGSIPYNPRRGRKVDPNQSTLALFA